VRSYHQLDVAVDAQGVAHVAAVLGGGIFYLTNTSGSWTRERLTTGSRTRRAIEIDGQPSIALDSDGSVWIAWVHYSGHGQDVWGPYPGPIRYATNRTGSWSAPPTIASGHSPSLQIRNGRVHVAYQVGYPIDVLDARERYPIRYATDAGGTLSDVLVANHGTAPQLRLASDGTPRVLFGDEYGLLRNVTELRYATGDSPTGPFNVERISGSRDEEAVFGFALDEADRPRIAWRAGDGEAEGLSVHVQEWNGAWSMPTAVLTPAEVPGRAGLAGFAVDSSRGAVHIVLDTAEWVVVGDDWEYQSNGLLYTTDRSAGVEQLQPAESAGFLDSLAIAIGGDGRVHVLFALEETDAAGLWYGVGPSR
jgi:hypothetical protein